jgi:hypothetical protein
LKEPPNTSPDIALSVLDYLSDLDGAVGLLQDTWLPEDVKYRADLYQQIMMSLSFSYFAFFHADPEHPDWAPLWNHVFRLQPNPDDIYLYSPLRGDLTYRVSGNRGTVALLIFTTYNGLSGMADDLSGLRALSDEDDRDLEIGPDEEFEIVFSANRPSNYSGRWIALTAEVKVLMVRCRSVDWANERDPHLIIECLDSVPPKRRLRPDEIVERIRQMARFPERTSAGFLRMQNGIKERVGVNTFEPVRYSNLPKQIYWPAVFEFDPDEALIIETELPSIRPYWNIQLNDPYFNAIEYVYRMSSLNESMARPSSDGRLRAVIALEDPGVPNWLDSSGFTEGTIYGRWYGCNTNPVPTITRVPLTTLREHLPGDTPSVPSEARAVELRARVRAAQRRRRW